MFSSSDDPELSPEGSEDDMEDEIGQKYPKMNGSVGAVARVIGGH